MRKIVKIKRFYGIVEQFWERSLARSIGGVLSVGASVRSLGLCIGVDGQCAPASNSALVSDRFDV